MRNIYPGGSDGLETLQQAKRATCSSPRQTGFPPLTFILPPFSFAWPGSMCGVIVLKFVIV
ncbi:hypothetical protein EK904_001845 [Melospiza melodia maxima]|nr:hypothetical protein EK904_001845 [Melospiza melodia maxima]